jgi:transposase
VTLRAWIGIVPRRDSTGGKPKLGPISKRGDQYLRRILVVGVHAVLKRARHQSEKYPWVIDTLEQVVLRDALIEPEMIEKTRLIAAPPTLGAYFRGRFAKSRRSSA